MANIVRFDCYEVDLPAGRLFKRGTKVNLRDKSFQILATLLSHPGEVITREALRQRLWRENVFVDFENNLNSAVARLREALGDSAEHPRFIETLPRHGYRFIASVSRDDTTDTEASLLKVRLLVLPFLNLTGDPGQEYLSDAITDMIITGLGSLDPDRLAVIARGTSMHYKASRKDLGRIRRDVNADFFVEGGVLRSGDTLCVNVQLVQARDQAQLYAKKYEGTSHDVFGLQDCIALAIAAHIPIPTVPNRAGEVGPSRSPMITTEHLAAYYEYVQARHQIIMARPSYEDLESATQHLEKAVAVEPRFALGHEALADLHWYLGYFGFVSPRRAFSAGIAHARRALAIDDTMEETHALLGQFHKAADYNWSEVHREMSLALQINPNSPAVRMRYAIGELMPQGQLNEAVAELQRALEFDPLSALLRSWLGFTLTLARRYERAIEECQKLLDIDPDCAVAYLVLSRCQRYLHNLKGALDLQRKAVKLSGGSATMLGWLGLTLAESGECAESNEVLDRLNQIAVRTYVPPASFAWIYLGLKEIDMAFEWLARAVEECDQLMMPIKSYAFLDPIRSDLRFAALLDKMHLA